MSSYLQGVFEWQNLPGRKYKAFLSCVITLWHYYTDSYDVSPFLHAYGHLHSLSLAPQLYLFQSLLFFLYVLGIN